MRWLVHFRNILNELNSVGCGGVFSFAVGGLFVDGTLTKFDPVGSKKQKQGL